MMNSTESEKFDILFVKHKNLLNEYAAFFPPVLFYCYQVVGQSEVKQRIFFWDQEIAILTIMEQKVMAVLIHTLLNRVSLSL